MTIMLATKTLEAIENAMVADQGASYRVWLGKVLPHIGDAYRAEDGGFRTHLGASVIGRECSREIWYGFHWYTKPKFKGQILRLFNRGHLEEGRIIALLLMIGCQVYQQDAEGKQYRISAVGGHFGGSGDGVALLIPDLPVGTACLLEFKTHNQKSWDKLAAEGVRSAKFEHYVQMNVYMRKMGIAAALYVGVNKNTDALHMEIIYLDVELANRFIERGRSIILAPEPPKGIGTSAGWFGCKFCDHINVCHLKGTAEKNCRTCKYSEAKEDGTWLCNEPVTAKTMVIEAKKPFVIPKHIMKEGCVHYEVR